MVAECFDCGLSYGSPAWVEGVVPHDVWNKHLSPTGNEGGILCVNCMARRAVDAGLHDVPMMLTAGPFVATCNADDDGINALCDELIEAARSCELNKRRRQAIRRAATLLRFAAQAIEARVA